MAPPEIKKTDDFNPEIANECFKELVEVFQKHKLTVGEMIVVYGNLGYTLGASIEGFRDKGPSIEELKKAYYTNPTPGISLMLSGLLTTSWYEDWSKIKIEENKGENNE